jgi:hypothetical protein
MHQCLRLRVLDQDMDDERDRSAVRSTAQRSGPFLQHEVSSAGQPRKLAMEERTDPADQAFLPLATINKITAACREPSCWRSRESAVSMR